MTPRISYVETEKRFMRCLLSTKSCMSNGWGQKWYDEGELEQCDLFLRKSLIWTCPARLSATGLA